MQSGAQKIFPQMRLPAFLAHLIAKTLTSVLTIILICIMPISSYAQTNPVTATPSASSSATSTSTTPPVSPPIAAPQPTPQITPEPKIEGKPEVKNDIKQEQAKELSKEPPKDLPKDQPKDLQDVVKTQNLTPPQPDLKIEVSPLPAPVAPTTVSPLPTPIVPPAAAPVTQQTAPTPSQPAISAPTTAPTLPSVASPPSPLTTLIPNAGDSVNVDSVVIPAKPVAIFKGKTTWESAFERITSAIKTTDEAILKEGLRVAGRPITLFISTDDNGFVFEVMRPIDRLVEGKTALNDQVRLGTTPEGKALRFVHKGPYDDVDSTYEAVTAYLDAKGVVVKDSFLEEYVSELTKSDDPNLEINIFVQPK